MKKISLILIVVISLLSTNLFAQVLDAPEEGARDSFYEKISFNKRIPFNFPYVREADVIWEWRVWRVIDFREKQNQVFYYPTTPEQGRVNLFYALEQAINDGRIKVYKDDEFKEEIDWATVKQSYSIISQITKDSIDIDGTEFQVTVDVPIELNTDDIKTLRIKENWFIDKQRTVQDVRIAGFSPIYYRAIEEGAAPIAYPLFWVRYDDPEVRELLANTEVYNFKNDAQRRTYDDIFLKRMFSSYIIRESSVYADRTISQYTTGDEALRESDNVKETIFNYEEDMWEY
ncbi:MAG: gliding motility protein GldN [Bacteroidales bacterium]|jgi:gliding motility associated protien GldN|nr:gliding motility protein GldN [Bacteroidales bacterium]MDD4703560.1 gliding motility protein GldN [Bacteroidales bacterium]MDX9798787.1 gliding motility protein GldN [Bacteroidales bacterium]